MRTSLILLVLVLLAVLTSADEFDNEKVKVGKKTCTCSFSLFVDGTKLSFASTGSCDKKCSGVAKAVKMEGDSGLFSFDMKVAKGKVVFSKGKVVPTPRPTGSGPESTTGSGPESTTGSGSEPETPTGTMPPTGSGSGEVPVPITGSGSGEVPVPITGSGSGPMPPTGSGPMPPTTEGMQCSCKCDCPEGNGQCDCDCNCPMQSTAMMCAPGFTRVCPMMSNSCPQETEKVCPKGVEESRSELNRMDASPGGCQCVPDFLMSLVIGGNKQSVERATRPDVFKNVKVKIGKKKCTCSFSLMADGDKLSPKSKAGCDKKCSGTAKGLELEGDSGNVYTLNLKSSKGKVTISQGSVEKGSTTEPTGPLPGSGSGPGPGSGSGPGKPLGSGSQCSCVGAGIGPMTGSGSGPMSGSGPLPGSGSTPLPGSGSESGNVTGSGSENGSGTGVTEVTEGPTGPTIPNPGSAASELTLSISQTWAQEPSGYERTAVLTVPATTAGQKVPVVFHLHGNGGQGNTRPVGDWLGEECIIVAPNGYERSWNVYTEKSKADDVGFIIDLIAKIGAEIPAADMNNVNIIGTSNGAALTYSLIIQTGADRPFRRAFPMVSSLISPQYHDNAFWKPTVSAAAGEANTHDISVVPEFAAQFEYAHFHGTEDGALKYDGQSPGPSFLGGADVLSAQLTDFLWAKAMGYTGDQITDSAGVSIGTDEKPVEEYKYLDGRVRHYKLIGEGHSTGPGHVIVQETVKAMIFA